MKPEQNQSAQEAALRQIDDIHNILYGNVKKIISGNRMIATGICIAAIPLIELFLSVYVDPFLLTAGVTTPLIFLLRTVFYWSLFIGIAKLFPSNTPLHPVTKQAFSISRLFPIIPIATAAMLAYVGYAALISPFILIILGCLFAFLGQFSQPIVTAIAWSYVIGGLVGVYLTTLSIDHLWMYLVAYQGLGCIAIGLYTRWENRERTAK